MAICDHQFHGGDESDWILSTSASCMDGSSTASRILQDLFKKHIWNLPDKNPKKKPKTISKPKPQTKGAEVAKPNEALIVKKISRICKFDDFDDSQHLNGCPMKWLYNKKLLEKNKKYKIGRLCSKKTVKDNDIKKEKSKSMRDKTPVEVKIHKINLIEKYTSNSDEIYTPNIYTSEKSERESKYLETHRKKLAAKLNWKLHNESQDCSSEQLSEISFRQNYLPPRPLMGLKPLLSVLLVPHQELNCCSFVPLEDSLRKKTPEASLSIQSLDLSLKPLKSKPRPNTTYTLRWGSKPSFFTKKLQIPNQITIKLDQNQKKPNGNFENHSKVFYSNPLVRKSTDKTKQKKSLSSLFYELKDKTNNRNQDEKRFNNKLESFLIEEEQFQTKRLFNVKSASSDVALGCKTSEEEKRKKLIEVLAKKSDLNLVCEKVRFFRKKSSQQENNGKVIN